MPLVILVAEVMLIYYFIQFYGFFNFLIFYGVSTILGIMLVRAVGSKSLRDFQTGHVGGTNRSMISRGLLFVSGLFLVVPSMATKIGGLLLTLPPVRWLMAIVFSKFLMKRVFNADSFVHQFGKGGFQFYYRRAGSPFQDGSSQAEGEYADNVIDAQFRKVEDIKQLNDPEPKS